MTTNNVAIIPARGGSKGIQGKNLIDFCGRPLLAWTILQAKASHNIDSVWVTSDSEEILEVALAYGAGAIKRPLDISGDEATSESAWLHAIDYIEKNYCSIDLVLALQATSPLREPRDIVDAVDLYYSKNYDSLLSVVEVEDFFMWGMVSGDLKSLNYDYRNRKRRQEIQKKYLENGSFYLFKPELLRNNHNRLGGQIGLYIMSKYKMFQIDHRDDIKLCESMMLSYGLDKLVNV